MKELGLDPAFAAWLFDVDVAVQRLADCSLNDLPDYCYRDCFDQGVSPTAAARMAIRQAIE